MPAASRCGCAAPLGSISTSLTGAPPSSIRRSLPLERMRAVVRSRAEPTQQCWSAWSRPGGSLRPAPHACSLVLLPFDDHQLMPNASRPTSCSRSSTSGRRSTSRRSARSPQWTPERARLPRPPCMAPARVTVAPQHLTVAPTRRQAHPQRPCRPPGRSRSRSRRHRACSWARWPPAASIGRSLSVVIFRCDRHACESVRNALVGVSGAHSCGQGPGGGCK